MMADEPKRLWSGFAQRTAAAAVEAGNVDAEREAHAEAQRAARALVMRRLQDELRRRQSGTSIAEEAKRVSAAYGRALQGVPGKDYWPDHRCRTCGGVEWLDVERNRIKMFHDPDKHGVDSREPSQRHPSQLSLTSLSGLAENIRARRSTGERDDDEE
jgi:hypothetical protein